MKEHNHVKKLKRFIASGRILVMAGTVSLVDVAHDDWCRIFKGKRCNCDPEIRVAWRPGPGSQN
jgi:hypothetical protein